MGCDADGSVNQFAEEIKMNLGAQMMVIYIFVTTTYRKRYLKDVTLQNKELAFVFEEEKTLVAIGDASMPFQRWFLVVLDQVGPRLPYFRRNED